jgi:hypothetical protein
MSFAVRQHYEVHSPGGPQSGLYSGSAPTFNSDGTINGAGATGLPNWYEPPQSGIGSSYWIRLTKTSGSRNLLGGVNGVWQPLSPNLQYGLDGAGNCLGDVDFSTEADGTPIVASGTFNINNTL